MTDLDVRLDLEIPVWMRQPVFAQARDHQQDLVMVPRSQIDFGGRAMISFPAIATHFPAVSVWTDERDGEMIDIVLLPRCRIVQGPCGIPVQLDDYSH